MSFRVEFRAGTTTFRVLPPEDRLVNVTIEGEVHQWTEAEAQALRAALSYALHDLEASK